jgi:hypothetical protein
MIRYAIALAAAVLALSACGGASSAPAHPAAAPAPLSFLRACQELRADMLSNGGLPDQPTADRLSTAMLGRGATGLPQDLGALDSDLKLTGTQGQVDAALDIGDVAADCQGQHVILPGS